MYTLYIIKANNVVPLLVVNNVCWQQSITYCLSFPVCCSTFQIQKLWIESNQNMWKSYLSFTALGNIRAWDIALVAHISYFCHGQDPKDRPWPSRTLSGRSSPSESSGDERQKQAATWLIYPGPPIFFIDSESPIKWLLGGADERCPWPPWPPLLGGPKCFWGAYDWWTILTPIESNIFGKLLLSNIIVVILGKCPDPWPP